AEGLGCEVLAAPDHLGAPDPFAVLSAAAQISQRMRLRTYVLNVGFWNPALLARTAATTDLLSAGRLELGLGAGHMRSEYEDAGLSWVTHRGRVDQMERTLIEVQEKLSSPGHTPRPVQKRIPVAVGAMTSVGLRVAARHADIVAFSGLLQIPGASPGTFTLASSAHTRERVYEAREYAAGREHRSDALLQVIRLGTDPRAAAEQLAAAWGDITAEQLLDTPFVLLARDASHALEILAQRHEDFGFGSFMAHEPNLDALGQILAVT
ncbi:MAG: TIGR03621 family F420-dependent LLM class oxidoreductase, partial [Solirubrobacteraceae bacterium]